MSGRKKADGLLAWTIDALEFLAGADASGRELRVLAALLSFDVGGRHGAACPSLDTLAEKTRISACHVAHVAGNLEQKGIIKRERGGAGPGDSTVYFLPVVSVPLAAPLIDEKECHPRQQKRATGGNRSVLSQALEQIRNRSGNNGGVSAPHISTEKCKEGATPPTPKDQRAEVWDLAAEVIGDTESNRAFVGKLVKEFPVADILEKLRYMKNNPPVDPRSYLARALRGPGWSDRQRHKAEDEAEARREAAESAAPAKLEAMRDHSPKEVPQGYVLELRRRLELPDTARGEIQARRLTNEYVNGGGDVGSFDDLLQYATQQNH